MSNFCRVGGSEEIHIEHHRLYKPCDSCNTKRVLKYYHNNKDKILEKKKFYYQNNKELLVNKTRNEKLKEPILKIKLTP